MENTANIGKIKNTKIIIATVVMVFVAIVAIAFFLINKEESYRSIQVYKVEGNVDVERPEVGVLEAYANMMLQTLDIVNVSDDSSLQVKLDDDKYILLEPNTKIRLEAAGNSQDSKTKIYVEKGAIVCNIENKLSENSTYEVSTPNSTMAVRGTTFRVEVSFDEAGNCYTVAAVYEGVVESQLIYPSGEQSEERVSITAGSQAQIRGTEQDTEYIITGEDVTYEELEQVTLDFLNVLLEKGTDLSITQEELTSLIEVLNNLDEIPSVERPQSDTTTPNTTQPETSESVPTEDKDTTGKGNTSDDKNITDAENTSDEDDISDENNESDDEDKSNDENNKDKDKSDDNNDNTDRDTDDNTDNNTDDSDDKTDNSDDNSDDSDDNSDDSDNNSDDSDDNSDDSDDNSDDSDDNSDDSDDNSDDSDDNSDDSDDNSDDSDDNTDDENVEPTKYTVTFTYKGVTFATQVVTSGECATTPRLRPTPKGYWDYDFSQPITADITLIWVDTTGLS